MRKLERKYGKAEIGRFIEKYIYFLEIFDEILHPTELKHANKKTTGLFMLYKIVLLQFSKYPAKVFQNIPQKFFKIQFTQNII